MKEIKKILCAVDFSETSSEVAEIAQMMAIKHEAKVHVLYIAPTLNQFVGFNVSAASVESLVDEVTAGAKKTMEDFLAKNFSDCDCKSVILPGYPAEVILAYAEKEQPDIIVMGTHGRKGFDRFLFGSVAERVVKRARCPVLTIRPRNN